MTYLMYFTGVYGTKIKEKIKKTRKCLGQKKNSCTFGTAEHKSSY